MGRRKEVLSVSDIMVDVVEGECHNKALPREAAQVNALTVWEARTSEDVNAEHLQSARRRN